MKKNWVKRLISTVLAAVLAAVPLSVSAEPGEGDAEETSCPLAFSVEGENSLIASLRPEYKDECSDYQLWFVEEEVKDPLSASSFDRNDTVELSPVKPLTPYIYNVKLMDGEAFREFVGSLVFGEAGQTMVTCREVEDGEEGIQPLLGYIQNESESNNTFSTADEIVSDIYIDQDNCMYGYISTYGDVDCYYVYAPRHGTLKFRLRVPYGTDYDMRLYSSGRILLASSVNPTSWDETITYNAIRNSSQEMFYVMVSGAGGSYSSSRYTLEYGYKNMNANALDWRYPVDSDDSGSRTITSTVGYRSYDGSYHTGMDIGAPHGKPVYSMCSGTIKECGSSLSMGNY